MTKRATFRSRRSPGKAGWWGRLFAALLFAFHVNFIPVHLAAEPHLHDTSAFVTGAALHHHDAHEDGDHHHDRNDHTPHHASDHTLTFTISAKAPGAPVHVLFLPPPIAPTLVCETEPPPPIPVFERLRPPGESPPDPRQPRAPPRA